MTAIWFCLRTEFDEGKEKKLLDIRSLSTKSLKCTCQVGKMARKIAKSPIIVCSENIIIEEEFQFRLVLIIQYLPLLASRGLQDIMWATV